jgi:hypothetical protein
MCEKNLDKPLEAVGSGVGGFDYPCLVLARYMGIGGEAYNLALFLSPSRSASFYCGTDLKLARLRLSLISASLEVPHYEVLNEY